jgi:MurNAc alpha-1-phosphate uridylyltransferase
VKVMILAAGKGERMRPLTEHTPKPLLKISGKALIDYHLERLAPAGFTDVVINCAWLGEQIIQHVGDGSRFGLRVMFSPEPEPLETAGGIIRALSLLKSAETDFFAVINADVWTDYPFALLREIPQAYPQSLAHLVMVDNPPQHPQGDFSLSENSALRDEQFNRLTYSGISVMHPQLFCGLIEGKHTMKPFLLKAIEQQRLTGDYYSGIWQDIGTPERLQELNQSIP